MGNSIQQTDVDNSLFKKQRRATSKPSLDGPRQNPQGLPNVQRKSSIADLLTRLTTPTTASKNRMREPPHNRSNNHNHTQSNSSSSLNESANANNRVPVSQKISISQPILSSLHTPLENDVFQRGQEITSANNSRKAPAPPSNYDAPLRDPRSGVSRGIVLSKRPASHVHAKSRGSNESSIQSATKRQDTSSTPDLSVDRETPRNVTSKRVVSKPKQSKPLGSSTYLPNGSQVSQVSQISQISQVSQSSHSIYGHANQGSQVSQVSQVSQLQNLHAPRPSSEEPQDPQGSSVSLCSEFSTNLNALSSVSVQSNHPNNSTASFASFGSSISPVTAPNNSSRYSVVSNASLNTMEEVLTSSSDIVDLTASCHIIDVPNTPNSSSTIEPFSTPIHSSFASTAASDSPPKVQDHNSQAEMSKLKLEIQELRSMLERSIENETCMRRENEALSAELALKKAAESEQIVKVKDLQIKLDKSGRSIRSLEASLQDFKVRVEEKSIENYGLTRKLKKLLKEEDEDDDEPLTPNTSDHEITAFKA